MAPPGKRPVTPFIMPRERQARSICGLPSGVFQSTLPRRERPLKLRRGDNYGCFNPRSHAGSDQTDLGNGHREYVSIHAPTQGATELVDARKELIVFQSTLPRRERRDIEQRPYSTACFNPRSHAGSDHECGEKFETYEGFNPRSHAGSDR